jgi:hypothetical protein
MRKKLGAELEMELGCWFGIYNINCFKNKNK